MENYPICRKCNAGDLVPLSDCGQTGGSMPYKAWVCTNPDCGYNVVLKSGAIYQNTPINKMVNGNMAR